ncbi:NnrS family protein [Marinobacter sp. SS13-12]|uniref:NnrS family protein n=1 Tax=Marinobacter sp. SS13-12 TaxID=3050451 RepID=UPI002553CA28|nr:NnrS family protein [Marinobacter sp. SS13-12]MDK8463220.1 NnrS family protein [Marinobacter sp. SS13-12]
MALTKVKPFHAFWLFFPAAALWAAVVVPMSIYAVLSGSGWPPGLLGAGHGHELIFGFALALIAGYTLGPQPWRVLAPLFVLWLVARLCWTLAPENPISQLLSPAFALLLAHYAVPRFQAAKKWRNKIAGPLILVLCLLSVAFWITANAPAGFWLALPHTRRVMTAAILGLLLLMTFMGGRIIAPAVAGTLEKRGIPLEARVQPRIEGTLLVILLAAMVFVLMPRADIVTGLALVLSAILMLIRALRWKLWRCMNRPDLLVLGIGYVWLAAGAGTTGVYLLQGNNPLPALHVITIGALGTLSISVMLRLAWQRARRTFPPTWQVLAIAVAMAVAVLARLQAGATPFAHPGLLWLSALCWSTAYGLVAIQLATLFRASQQRRK